MEAHPRTLRSIFRQDLRLLVPLFQRPYVWQASTQWQPLWEDVVATVERTDHGDDTPHFLGAVVLQLRRGAVGSVETREIIDGQQRLTTLQLLIAAALHVAEAEGVMGRTRARLQSLLFNNPDLVDDPEERFKLWPTNRDRGPYEAVMSGRADGAGTDSRILQAYTWFTGAVRSWVSGQEDVEEALTRLAGVLADRLEVVAIDLGEDDNAQIIFETLNARGTPLRAADLVKNLLFRALQDAGRPVERLYRELWSPFEDPYWEQDVRQGRLTRPRIDTFLGHFLVVLLQTEVQAHDLFAAARRHVGADPDRAEAFLRELARYGQVYRRVDAARTGAGEDDAALNRLRMVDTQTLLPLLLWLVANTDGPERTRAVRSLESFVVRRLVCRLTTANYNRMFLELLRRLGGGEAPVGEVTEAFLAGQRSASGVWPTSDDVRDAFETRPLYKMLRREQLQRLLLALDAAAGTARTEPVPHSARMSVEHLLPQSWSEHWPLPPDPVSAETVEAEREELVHTIGNLTVITGSLNSAMSNAAWPIKRDEILRYSALTLNRDLPEDWNTYRIRERSAWLAELAVTLWSRPVTGDEAAVREAVAAAGPVPEIREDADAPVRTGRGDIAAHIKNAMRTVAPGEFMTVSQIARVPSADYPAGSPPSQGAIAARLFPRTGRPTTVPGVRAEIREGRRGATRL
ncbi:hypothetical protein N866_15310 [Actinotalea ferrariae CF5-4]|uniref:DUF262 domain-containing protein n=1 Tax=Actinotalea ferrariae CF5-4 TaxID=948458 RepID=A0A021VVD6_9CELL|nr:DUF262 domain-containing protein [Actinotalea ferrariae]EYR65083.1 hypothetical protein N866_15310 [Actinotalea ferrariae CF5-4]